MLTQFRSFLLSPAYLPFPLIISMAGLLGDEKTKITSMIINVFIITLILFLSDDLLPALLPAFCIITLGATLLQTLEIVIPYIPVTFPMVAGLLFHLIRYRRPIHLGLSFWGLVITSTAILISGIGTEWSTRDYSSPGAVYHLIGLSVGLIVLYLLFATNYREDRTYDPYHYYLMCVMVLGLLCSAVVLDNFIEWFLPRVPEMGGEVDWTPRAFFDAFPYCNTITTLAVMCLPAPFYMAKQTQSTALQVIFFAFGLVIYLGAVLPLARTAILFGTLLLLLCIIYYAWGRDAWNTKAFNLTLLIVSASAAIYILREPLLSLMDFRRPDGWISENEARVRFLLRSFENFLAHPLFGIGITSTANSDIYSAPGCICWYHMYFPQLWGSMGVFGLLSYGVQFLLRARLVFTMPDRQSLAMGLVYLGLFLYSQTDPGEFAPLPFVALIIPLFLLLEGRARHVKRIEEIEY